MLKQKMPPPGKKRSAKIERVQVSRLQEMDSMMTAARTGVPFYCPAGEYTRLIVDGKIMMSNTPMEHTTNQPFINQAKGDVLIAGLGLGLILTEVLENPMVNTVTVLEANKDVIALTGPTFKNSKLKIIHADVFVWQTLRTFDTIYFDIWPTLNPDNLKEMTQLHRKYRHCLREGGWIGSWSQRELRILRKKGY